MVPLFRREEKFSFWKRRLRKENVDASPVSIAASSAGGDTTPAASPPLQCGRAPLPGSGIVERENGSVAGPKLVAGHSKQRAAAKQRVAVWVPTICPVREVVEVLISGAVDADGKDVPHDCTPPPGVMPYSVMPERIGVPLASEPLAVPPVPVNWISVVNVCDSAVPAKRAKQNASVNVKCLISCLVCEGVPGPQSVGIEPALTCFKRESTAADDSPIGVAAC